MVVLSTGLEVAPEVANLAGRLGVRLDQDRFVLQDGLSPVATSVPGVYACGAFTGPKDIPHSVMEASAAACAATEGLAVVRHSRTRAVERVPEREVRREPPRIGVFVCNCGVNIGGVIAVPEVARYARSLPHVVYVEENLFTCSQDTQEKMAAVIREKGLNRVVVAACTPRTHEGLFQETLIAAGLNRYLLEMANIRNHASWVHAAEPASATQKAKDLVRMAVAKSVLLAPLEEQGLPVQRAALVVGGGVAGMTSALSLARQGYPVHLVEREPHLGGNGRALHRAYNGRDIPSFVERLTGEVKAEERITLHTGSSITRVEGFVGNFRTEIEAAGERREVVHGIAILAVGAEESGTGEYLHGRHPAVVTHLEMDRLLAGADPRVSNLQEAAFIQCVGSRDREHPYCSKVCCSHSLRSALEIKERNPEARVYVFYRDMRAYGKREHLYREAREKGVLFFRYAPERKPLVEPEGERVRIEFHDPVLQRMLAVRADLLCLATAIVPRDSHSLARLFKVPVDEDGWLLEAHQKLRPVDFANDGVFLCGMAHYPKPVEESVAQAKAAAARAMTFLARDRITLSGVVTRISPELCSGCGGCVRVCPYGAISLDPAEKTARVNPALCKGCGACAAACPSEAAILEGFNHRQLYAQIRTALS